MTIKNRGSALALAVALAGSACAEVDVAEPQPTELGATVQALSLASVTEDPRALSNDWPSAGHDWAHTGHAPAETLIGRHNVASLTALWQHTFSLSGEAEPVPVIATAVAADGVAYIVDAAGYAHARTLADGTLLWTSSVSHARPDPVFNTVVQAGPVVTSDALYVGDTGATISKVDRHTGALLWAQDVDAHPEALIQGDLATTSKYVVFGVSSFEGDVATESDLTMRGSVVALERETGALHWQLFTTSDQTLPAPRYGAGVGVWSSPAIDVDAGRVYIGTGQHYEPESAPGTCIDKPSCTAHKYDLDLSDSLLSVELESGELKGSRQFTKGDVFGKLHPDGKDFDVAAPPNLFEIQRDKGLVQVVGVGDKEGTYYVLDRHTFEPVWSRRVARGSVLGGIQATAAYADGVLYVAGYERADGSSLNTAIPPGQAATFLTTEEGFLTLQGDSRTNIMALDAATGAVRWQSTITGAVTFAPLIVANGVLFQGDANGALRGFDTDTGALLWQTQLGGFPVEGGYLAGNIVTGLSLSAGRLMVSSLPLVSGAPVGVTAFGPPACVPSCGDRQCGDDGCGGSCGSCDANASCSSEGVCRSRACSAPRFDYHADYRPGSVVTSTCSAPYVGTSCYQNLGVTFAWRCDYPVWCWLRPGSVELGWWSVWTAIERCP